MSEIKLCKMCKWYKGSWYHPYVRCTHPNNVEINPINGKKMYYLSLYSLRTISGRCSKEAKWFEKK